MRDAWKQEKLIRLYAAKKKLLSNVDTTFRSPVGAHTAIEQIKAKFYYIYNKTFKPEIKSSDFKKILTN